MGEEKKVTCLSDYLEWIKKVKDSNTCSRPFQTIYYRGQANRHWSLVPSLFRQKKNGESSSQLECMILREAQHRLWSELATLPTYLEKLVYLQHYGMPTRLLDVTFNPLIALYFACEEAEHEGEAVDGKVFWGNCG